MVNVKRKSILVPKNKWLRWIFYIGLSVSSLLSILFFIFMFVSCFHSLDNICKNSFPETFFSPNGNYKAISFLQSCNATDGYEPGVSIFLADDEFDSHDEGNVFQCYRCGCTYVSWISDNELLIQYCWPTGTGFVFESPNDFLYVQEESIFDVTVTFELIEEE